MSRPTRDEQQAMNREHRLRPEVGDYWSDMCCPVAVVRAVDDGTVVYCDKTEEVDDGHWTWNLKDGTRIVTRKHFAGMFLYGSPGLEDQTFCDVSPKAHTWVAYVEPTHTTDAAQGGKHGG